MGDIAGPDLTAARERAGLTQQQVADALRVSRQTIVTWEGKALVPPTKAERYLRAVADLASGRGEGSSQ